MLLVKRLSWIFLGLLVGLGGTMVPRVVAQGRAAAPPPIAIKFIGVLEQGSKRVAIFSDDQGQPFYASEGQIVQGQYKLLKIGIDSVTMSFADGTGVQSIPMARNQRLPAAAPPASAPERDQVIVDHPASGSTAWKFVSDSKTRSCWLAATTPTGRDVTALAPAPADACR